MHLKITFKLTQVTPQLIFHYLKSFVFSKLLVLLTTFFFILSCFSIEWIKRIDVFIMRLMCFSHGLISALTAASASAWSRKSTNFKEYRDGIWRHKFPTLIYFLSGTSQQPVLVQSGFCPLLSTETVLVKVTNDLLMAAASGPSTTLIL